MSHVRHSLAIGFLCLQVFFVSVTGLGMAASDDLHIATAHQLALDHHHHDDFSSHFDHDDGVGAHVHVVDSYQSFGLIQESSNDLNFLGSRKQPRSMVVRPPDVFLEGFLRPPQMIL